MPAQAPSKRLQALRGAFLSEPRADSKGAPPPPLRGTLCGAEARAAACELLESRSSLAEGAELQAGKEASSSPRPASNSVGDWGQVSLVLTKTDRVLNKPFDVISDPTLEGAGESLVKTE